MSKLALLFLLISPLCFSKSFSVSTQNLWHYTRDYDQRLFELESFIEFEKADIMTFQEAWKHYRGKSLFKAFLRNEDYNVHYVRSNNTGIMKEGLAIVSTFQQSGKKHSFKLPFSKFFGKRLMLVSEIAISAEKSIYVINVHLSPFGDRKHERIEQLKFIIEKIKNRFSDKPIILTGDFNQDQEKDFFSPLLKIGFSYSARKEKVGCTFCDDNPYTDGDWNSKLDYIFYQKKFFELLNVRKTFEGHPISDHYGLRAVFNLL
ncbi:hypothetical protein A9Q84_07600 [Halobacteriovorax marinus]|uniref:Endonuclease/exonuclease/phosphatase domain-containing protein n=1 Tax=Halobacteriovorax marinus TaxID=97084 RepID=A0A1Y5F5Z8_9BACT|nr:hypothetical protein A9Q84_07600 [Halobacteriovorax marinus]